MLGLIFSKQAIIRQTQQKTFLIPLILFLIFSAGIIHAQVAPELTNITPRAAQRGQTIDITLEGKNINEKAEIWFNNQGIKATIKHKAPSASVRFNGSGISGDVPTNPRLVLSFEISKDAPLGNHQIRLITPNGVSNAQNFIIGDLPEIMEQEPNGMIDTANMLTLPVTVNGTINSIEDVDYFRFNLRKGARLICDINAQRMGSALDSYIELYDPSGNELVKSQDGNGLDSFIDYTTQTDGEYKLYLRDVRYQGGGNHRYRLSIGELPYLQSVFPLGGKRGAANNVTVAGANLGSLNTLQLNISPDASTGIQELRVNTEKGLETNPYPFAIGEFNETNETEPNNTLKQENKIGTPITVNGKIEKAGDVDRYVITVEKGVTFVIEVQSRQFRSLLDPLLTIYSHKKGESEEDIEEQVISVNDDASGTDAIIRFTAPEAGDYGISVRDLNNSGGGDYPYRLTIRPLNPRFQVNVSTDNPRITQGGTFVLTVSAARIDGFNGGLKFYSPDLPKGFVVSPTILYPTQNQAMLTITAPDDADLGLHNFSIVGVGSIGDRRIEVPATPKEILLTVMKAPPFTLEVADIDINVVHNKTTNFHVIAHRREGFNDAIALNVAGIPGRVSGGKATIAAGKNSAMISLRAGTVERREQFSVVPIPGTSYISVTGTANINREAYTEATPAIPITIHEAPFIVTIEPLRFSIVFPKSKTADEPVAAVEGDGAVVPVSNPSPTENTEAEKVDPIKKIATLTMSIVRRGSFTDIVTITPILLPEGITVPEATIPMNENDVEVNLEAISTLEAKTYQVKFRGTAVINGTPFVQESPIINVKIIK